MSFPRYPKYKPSGVEALGEVPDGWSVLSLKRVVNPARQITYGIVQAGPHVPDGVPYIRPADMSAEDGIKVPDEIMRTSDEIAANYTRSTIRAGDIVCSIGPSFGKVMITPAWLDGANLTQGTARIAVQREHNSKYIFWTLRAPASVAQWVSSVGGATFSALNLGPLARTTILIPPLPEQTAIAEFLDLETGKIDGLVAEQRRLMELLKEKRQAVISHAVTKGLNPHAPMKPSGIEWLGDVPAGWELSKISAIANILAGHSFDASLFGSEGTPVIRMSDFGDGSVRLDDAKRVEPTNVPEKSLAQTGDILLGLSGSISNFAEVSEHDLPIAINQRVAIVRINVARRSLVTWFLQSAEFLNQITAELPETTIQNVSMGQLRRCRIPLPPLIEQTAIFSHLTTETAKLAALIAEAQRAIDLLQERRTALISAAVTGQIDVRQQTRN